MLRHKIWSSVDDVRCGIINDIDNFLAYSNYILNCPPIFLPTQDGVFTTGEKSLQDIYKNSLLTNDIAEHALSMAFPYVRLKTYIEIRVADSMPFNFTLSLLALIKGVFYNQFAIEELLQKFGHVKKECIESGFLELKKHGYEADIYGYKAKDLLILIFDLAKKGLNSKEKEFLKPFRDLVSINKVVKDIL